MRDQPKPKVTGGRSQFGTADKEHHRAPEASLLKPLSQRRSREKKPKRLPFPFLPVVVAGILVMIALWLFFGW